MIEKALSIKEIDNLVDQHNMSLKAGVGAVDIAGIYKTIRPILVLAENLLTLFKPTWAAVIVNFVAALDKSYPTA